MHTTNSPGLFWSTFWKFFLKDPFTFLIDQFNYHFYSYKHGKTFYCKLCVLYVSYVIIVWACFGDTDVVSSSVACVFLYKYTFDCSSVLSCEPDALLCSVTSDLWRAGSPETSLHCCIKIIWTLEPGGVWAVNLFHFFMVIDSIFSLVE